LYDSQLNWFGLCDGMESGNEFLCVQVPDLDLSIEAPSGKIEWLTIGEAQDVISVVGGVSSEALVSLHIEYLNTDAT